MERTLAIIKPDAVSRGLGGKILARIEAEDFKIKAMKMLHLTKAQAQGFYAVHKNRPFFDSLTDFMSSGPVMIMILEREEAISRWRTVMGATDPKEATEGTIRREFALDKEKNATHGSDAPETAAFEMGYFFNALEIMN
ncbi:MAG: nucleoside-diphosphate kinase [Thermodesulfobacteriota bacterium]